MWYPANRFEREMAHALAGGKLTGYFGAVLRADLFVPHRGTPDGDDGADWRPVTREAFGETVIPVFTSDDAVLDGPGGEARSFLVTSYQELRDGWPDPRWRLALNPGLPIEAYLPVTAAQTWAESAPDPAGEPELILRPLGEGDWQPWPPGGPAAALHEAVVLGDGAEYLDALLSCQVVVATTRRVPEAEIATMYRSVLLSGPGAVTGYPWRIVPGPSGESLVAVFTDPVYAAAAYPQAHQVTTGFRSMLTMRPAGCGVSVNPGGPAGLDLPVDHVPLLARWHTLQPVPPPLLLDMRWARERQERAGEG